MLQNLAKELMNRGHELTAIVNYPISNFQSPNYTEVLIDPPLDASKIRKSINLTCSYKICAMAMQFASFLLLIVIVPFVAKSVPTGSAQYHRSK